MTKKVVFRKGLVIGIIVFFIGAGIAEIVSSSGKNNLSFSSKIYDENIEVVDIDIDLNFTDRELPNLKMEPWTWYHDKDDNNIVFIGKVIIENIDYYTADEVEIDFISEYYKGHYDYGVQEKVSFIIRVDEDKFPKKLMVTIIVDLEELIDESNEEDNEYSDEVYQKSLNDGFLSLNVGTTSFSSSSSSNKIITNNLLLLFDLLQNHPYLFPMLQKLIFKL